MTPKYPDPPARPRTISGVVSGVNKAVYVNDKPLTELLERLLPDYEERGIHTYWGPCRITIERLGERE